MTQQILEARQKAEEMIGRRLLEEEFQEALAYAEMKAKAQGNGPDYVSLLLPDVVREMAFQQFTWELAHAKKELEEARSQWKHDCRTGERLERFLQTVPKNLLRYVSAADLLSLIGQTA